MPWVKLTDDFFDNVKVIRAGRDARDLYIAGLCFCARRLTDGFIPEEQVGRLAADAGLDSAGPSVQRLLDVNLWERTEGGFNVHDWRDYNPTREEALALREARAQAGSIGGQRSGESKREAKRIANAVAKPEANAKQNEYPVSRIPGPVPEPGPEPDLADAGASAVRESVPVTVPAEKPKTNGKKSWPWSEQLGALLEAVPINCPFDDAPDATKGEYRKAAEQIGRAHFGRSEIQNTVAEMHRLKWTEDKVTASSIAKWCARYGRRAPPVSRFKQPARSVWDYTDEELAKGVNPYADDA